MIVVKIKPERCNTIEEKTTLYYIAEANGDRCFISPVNWHNDWIRPQELVMLDDLIIIGQ